MVAGRPTSEIGSSQLLHPLHTGLELSTGFAQVVQINTEREVIQAPAFDECFELAERYKAHFVPCSLQTQPQCDVRLYVTARTERQNCDMHVRTIPMMTFCNSEGPFALFNMAAKLINSK